MRPGHSLEHLLELLLRHRGFPIDSTMKMAAFASRNHSAKNATLLALTIAETPSIQQA